MSGFVIDADGHIMEDHKDIFAHIKGNFAEMDWHSTWPMFDADGWQRMKAARTLDGRGRGSMFVSARLSLRRGRGRRRQNC